MNQNIEEKLDLDITGILSKLDKVDNRFGATLDKMKEVAKIDPFRDAARASVDLDKQALKSVDTYVKVTNSAKAYEAEIKRLVKEKERLNKSQKEFIAAGNYDKYQKELKRVNDRIKEVNTSLGKTPGFASKFGNVVSNLSGGLLSSTTALLGGIGAALGIVGKKAYDAQSGFEGVQSQLEVGLKSEEDTIHNLTVLEKLALRLPGALTELTDNFAKLVDRGFRPTKDEIANLSALAVSKRKTFDQLTEAILDAEVGELERLKEFGIQAKNEGNKVKITFGDVTKTFVKGARESASAFAAMSKELGLGDLNDKKMNDLAGRASNLGDQFDRIYRLVGKLLTPTFNAFFDLASKGLSVIDDTVTGFSLMDEQLKKNAGTINEQVYPGFNRLFDLFKPGGASFSAMRFAIELRYEWETFKNQMSIIVSQLQYYFKLYENFKKLGTLGNGFGVNDFNKANEAARQQYEADQGRYLLNYVEIAKAKARAITEAVLNGKREDGELEYSALGDPIKNEEKDRAELERQRKVLEDRKKALEKAQKDLQDKLLELEKQYGQDRLEALQNDKLAYLAEKKRLDLLEIDEEEKTLLKLKQLAAGAQKGRFDKQGNPIADTSVQLTDAERAPLNFRREAVIQREYAERAEFEAEQQRQLTRELSNEYQRQLQDVEEKYERLFKLADKNEKALQQLRIRKAQETEEILLQQELDALDQGQRAQTLSAEIELYDAQAQGRIDIELGATRKLLEIEKDFMQQKLALITASGADVAGEQVQEFIVAIAKLDAEIAKVDNSTKKTATGFKGLFLAAGGNEEGFEAFQQFAGQFQNVLQDLFQVQMEMSQRKVDAINREIEAKRQQIDEEKRLNEQGLANNLDLRNKELEQLKKSRETALKNQQRLVRLQLIADTAAQTSSMVTAAANLFASESKLGVLGLALAAGGIGVMFAAFLAAKVKAFQASKQVPVFEKGGPHRGKRHSQGGELVEVEDGEYTTNRHSTAKYYDLIEAINEDDSARIRQEALKHLLDGAGVSLHEQERRASTAFMQHYGNEMAQQKSKDTALLERIEARLSKIEASNERIPETQLIPLGKGQYMEKGPNAMVIRDVKGMMR